MQLKNNAGHNLKVAGLIIREGGGCSQFTNNITPTPRNNLKFNQKPCNCLIRNGLKVNRT